MNDPVDTGSDIARVSAAATITIAVCVGAVLWVLDSNAASPSLAGMIAMVIGVSAGKRPVVGVGIVMFAIATMVAASGWSASASLMVHATMALVLMTMLVLSDVSFLSRRNAEVATATLRGSLALQAAASVIGVAIAATAFALATGIAWPTWLATIPIVALAVGAVVGTLKLSRYRQRLANKHQRPRKQQVHKIALPPPPPSQWQRTRR